MSVRLSVLICTYNRHELLNQALEALLHRTIEKPDQVIVVNGGDEQADHVVSSQQQRCAGSIDLVLLKTTNRNLAVSRNVGLAYCDGDIVAMTDDDAEVFPDWISQIKRVHEAHPEAGAVGGPVHGASSDSKFLSRLADRVTFPRPRGEGYVRTLPGVNVAYKRSVLDKIGLQDETLFRGEDVDFNWRVLRAGYKILYHPEIQVLHHHRPTLAQFFRQHHMYGRAYYLVRKKWPDMYCVYPRSMRKPKDFLKLLNFVASTFYEPVLYGFQFGGLGDKLRAVPVLVTNHLAWKSGMIYQMWIENRGGR